MMRQQVVKFGRSGLRSFQRSFSVASVRAAEGDTGGIRPGGQAARYVPGSNSIQARCIITCLITDNNCRFSDSFTRREQASEGLYIREKERER